MTTPPDNTTNPPPPTEPTGPYFAPLNPAGPLGEYVAIRNEFFWKAIHRVLPTPGDDVDIAFSTLARNLDVSRDRAEKLYHGVARMASLPKLAAHHERGWYLDDNRLVVIGQMLIGVDDHLFHLIDDALVRLFTPTRKNQVLPDTSRVRKVIREILYQYYDLTRDTPEDCEDDGTRYRMDHRGQNSFLNVRMDGVDAEAIHEHIRKYAKANNCSFTKAMVDLILNGSTTTVVVNVFKPEGESMAYLPEHGVVTLDNTDLEIIERQLGPDRVEGYVPTAAQRAFIEARDGTCRRAHCTVPAKYAQLDHRVEYGEGGETSTDNLIAVCQHHHNAKTDRRCDYLFDPVTGFVYWLFEDGTWESTEPQGIMAQRWRQSISQRTEQLAAERNLIPLPEPEETSFAD